MKLHLSNDLLIISAVLLSLAVSNLGKSHERLRLIRADKLEQFTERDTPVKKLTGDVHFRKGKLELKCDLAYWFENEERADFYHNVIVTKQSKVLQADTLTYYSDKDVIYARGHTSLKDDELILKSESMTYFVNDEIVEADGNVFLEDRDRDIQADFVTYFSNDKKAVAINNAVINDKKRRTSLFADSLIYFNESGNIEATKEPVLIRRDSSGIESFRISGDIIEGHEDEGNFLSKGNVEIWREDFKAYSEIVDYVDSLESATLIGNPRVVSNDQELSGKKMVLYLKDESLHSLFTDQSAMATSTSKAYLPAKSSDSTGTATRDSIKVHDEITGKNMEIYFKNGKTDSIRVSGMAISYYNVLEDSIIQGVNITSGDTVVMTFQNGKISLITVIGGTQGRFIPDRTNEKVDTTVIYSSERIDYFLNDKVTNLIERSSIKSGDLALTAGKISIDWNKNLLYAFPLGIPPYDSITGNVPTLNQKGTEPFSGESMVYNMRTQKGRIIEGATKVEDGFYYGSDIHKTDKEVFYVSDGIYTTCDIPEHPHYYFKSKKMKLIQKDKIIARPIVLYIHDIPILGLPFGIFPNKGGRRHSGWIMPTYGENKSVGGFIKGLGYFWAPNDYMDLRFTGDFFDKKGIIFHYKTRYSLRYKFNGSLNGSYSNDFFSNFPKRQWSLNVNHSHKISPTMRLSINGRFVSSDSYYRKMGINRDTRLNQQLISNATLSKTWPGKPYSLSMNFNQTKNLQANTQILSPPTSSSQKVKYVNRSLPNISFSRSQKPIIPLKPWKDASQSKWYNNIYFTISSRLKNKQDIYYQSTAIEEDSLIWEKQDIKKNAITHNISLNSSQKLLSFITLNQNMSINEGWVFEYYEPVIDSEVFVGENKVYGFKARHTGSASLNAQTKIYGLFPLRIGALQAVRHVITPRIGLSYRPDFTQPIFGWDPGYVQYDVNGNKFDPFSSTLLGSTPSGEQKSLTVSVRNIFQAKTKHGDKEKKFDLFTANLSTNYNFAAESPKWAPISSNLRTQVTKKLAINLSASHDLYAYNSRKWNKTWYGIPIPRLTSLSASTGFSLSGKRFGKIAPAATVTDTSDTMATDIISPSLSYDEDLVETPLIRGAGSDFWNANFSFRYSFSQRNPEISKSESLWMTFNLKVKITSKWKLGYRANFDLLDKRLVSQDIHIDRDLHCWQLSFGWTPSGYGKQYTLLINVKAPSLKDLKYEERGGRRRGYGF